MQLIERNLKHVWHPCSQMKDYATFPPLEIVRAEGSYLLTADGQEIIDGISSWWCKTLGHQHPRLQRALRQQSEKFEHILLANATHQPIVELSERLASLTPNLNKVSYASDGACAVEMALKMSFHARQLLRQTNKNQFMALQNGYHGETALALAVSDAGGIREPYQALLPSVSLLKNLPYVHTQQDLLWQDCGDMWPNIEQQLTPYAAHLTAIIIEPLLQGAGNMRLYSQDFLKRLRAWCNEHDVHLIADEIFTGLGWTGKALACDYASIEPDFLCLAKGLTAGYMPMSAMLTSTAMYELFYDDYHTNKAFLHSHTHTGNALAASIALEVFKILEEENIYQQVQQRQSWLFELMQSVADETKLLHNVRGIGGMVAADLMAPSTQRIGYKVFQEAAKLGALLRPIGNTLYWLLPLNSDLEVFLKLHDITCEAIFKATKS